ncbi:MAG: hypothetical protein A2583_01560, partial [Bdellovibrionales bacterium RIFOXYD1_FULL_53_11]
MALLSLLCGCESTDGGSNFQRTGGEAAASTVAQPSNIAATATTDSSIALAWTDNASNETGFELEKCSGSACTSFTAVSASPLLNNATTHTEAGLSPSTIYRFRIRAVGNGGTSSNWTVSDNITTSSIPSAPTSISKSILPSGVTLSWVDNATSETAFTLERCAGANCRADPANFVTTVSSAISANATSYTDSTVVQGTTYNYRLKACNTLGCSDWLTLGSDAAVTSWPTFGVEPTESSKTAASVTIGWGDSASDNGYEIRRCLASSCTYSTIGTAVEDATSFTDYGLSSNTAYKYQARPLLGGAGDDSGWKPDTPLSITTYAAPTAPSSFVQTMTDIGATTITFSWTDNTAGAGTHYIEKCTGAGCTNFAALASVAAGVTSYQAVGLTAGTIYRFRVRSYQYGAYSSSYLTSSDISTKAYMPWMTDGPVHSSLISGSTMFIGGDFLTIGPYTGTGISITTSNANMTAALIGTLAKVNGTIYCVIPDGGSGFYIGGSFTAVGGASRKRVARIAFDGSVGVASIGDTFTVDNGEVRALALNSLHDTLYVGGTFTTVNGATTRNHIAKVSTLGALDGWNPNLNGNVYALVANEPVIYAGGAFTDIGGGTTRNRLVAINSTTGAATAWDPNSNGTVHTLLLDGTTLYAGGDFTALDATESTARSRLASISTADGSINTFTANANGSVRALALDGTTLYAGGLFTQINSSTRNYIAAVDTSTGDVTSWNPSANSTVFALSVDSNSNVYAGGSFTQLGGQTRYYAGALNSSGTTISWHPASNDTVYGISIYSTYAYLGGSFTSSGGYYTGRLAAIDLSTGIPKSWFAPKPSSTVRALAANSTGSTLYFGGDFTTVGSSTRNRIAAASTGTGSLTSWNPGVSSHSVHAIALDSTDANVYVGGTFTGGTAGGVEANYLAS